MAAITLQERKRRIKYIKENWDSKTLKQMAAEQSVNVDCIAQWGKKLNLKKYKITKYESVS